MAFALILLILLISLLLLFKYLNFNMKFGFIILGCLFIVFTLGIFVIKPQMHKPFSIDIIDYLIKINDDGTITKTKQVTKTIIKKEAMEVGE